MQGQSELDSVSFSRKNKNACFQGGHFVCVGEGKVVVMVVCGVGPWV